MCGYLLPVNHVVFNIQWLFLNIPIYKTAFCNVNSTMIWRLECDIGLARSCLCLPNFFSPSSLSDQEYRDTSKQQEIKQQRQHEKISPGFTTKTVVARSGVMSPPALLLQLRNSACSLSLWQNLEVVQESGMLTQLPKKEIIIQEANSFVIMKSYSGRLLLWEVSISRKVSPFTLQEII